MAAPGALIAGRYRLIRQLGAGGMGVVWEARDERLDRLVAVKQLRTQPGLTDDETDVIAQRAMREARITARLQHPYAVSVFDVVEHEGKPCIVMEFVPSVPLTAVMRELGALAPSESARVGSEVAAALAAAHALGIVHRDVKPGNVLIGDDGTARICDFGISRAHGDTTLTMTGMLTGTPAYLAPEVARGGESTFASDVHSLGATLYAAVEGEPPFGTDGNAMAVLYRVVAGEMRPPERAGSLGPLLIAMMSTEPHDRPTMAEAAVQLSALVDGGTHSARPGAPLAGPPFTGPAQPGTAQPGTAQPGTALPGGADQTRPMPLRETTEPTAALPPPSTASTSSPGTAPRPGSAATPAAASPPTVGLSPAPAPVAATAAAAAQRSETPASPPPRQPAAEPASGRRRRPAMIAAIVALLVVGGILAVVLLSPGLGRLTAGTEPSPSVSDTSGAATRANASATPSGEATATPTAAELAQAVTDYYDLLPDDTDAGWQLLTPSYQRQTGGRDSYEDFWNAIDTVTVSDVRGTPPDRVEATITYVEKSGNRRSTERRSYRLVPSDGVLKINQSSVI